MTGFESLDVSVFDPLETLDLPELLARPPAPPDWIWMGRLAAGDVALWAGDPGCGKSMVAIASGGGTVLDEPTTYGSVVMVDLENTVDVLLERVRAFTEEPDALDLHYVHRPLGFNLAQPEWQQRLGATLAAYNPRLLVVDSLRRAAPALDENDSQAVSTLMATLRELANVHGCPVVLVHHPRKPLADGAVDALHAARGSGDLVASVDSLLFFRRLKGGLVKIEHAKARRGHPHEPVHYRIVENEAGGPLLELVDVQKTDEGDLDRRVLEYVREHPGEPQKDVEEGVEGGRESIRKSLERLATLGHVARGAGRHPAGKYWYPANHAGLQSPGDTLAIPGDMSLSTPNGGVSPVSPGPRRAGDNSGDTFDDAGLELDWR